MESNEKLFERACRLIPGGVHSPVRSFKGLDMSPRFVERAKGAFLYDVEGADYIDFCMSFGPLICGHADEEVGAAVAAQLEKGFTYGACETLSLELAEKLVELVAPVEQVRLVNSGTEAVMSAIRLARGYTGRSKILKFAGCYHGHSDALLIRAGSGLAGTAEASSAGVPAGVAEDTLIVELDDLPALEACLAAHKRQVAAIIVEPLPANNGLLIQSREFLQALRSLADEHGALLIFDEVISGLRVGPAGMIGRMGITPDLVTYGKILGGGLPVGALAGRREIMEWLAPIGPVYQAGTLSANPLALAAGLANLAKLTPEAYKKLEENSKRVLGILSHWLEEFFAGVEITSYGSLFWPCTENSLSRAKDIPADLEKTFAPLFKALLAKGVYLAPSAWEVGFISLAHDEHLADELERRLWS